MISFIVLKFPRNLKENDSKFSTNKNKKKIFIFLYLKQIIKYKYIVNIKYTYILKHINLTFRQNAFFTDYIHIE